MHHLQSILLFVLVVGSVLVSAAVIVRPEQVLLHLTTSPDVVQVSFVTRGGAFLNPSVQYGTSTTKLTTHHACVTDKYKTVPTWDAHGAVHTCKISGLKNNQKIYYRVGSTTEKHWSSVRNFTALHINPTVTKLAISGDIGSWKDSSQSVVDILNKRHDLAAYVTCGDIAYATFSADVAPKQIKNDDWGNMNSKLLSHIPQVPVYGNHDMYDNKGLPYERRYNVHVRPTDAKVHWFSLNIGGIHLAVIDNLYDQSATSGMIKWLEADLSAARTKRASGAIQHIVVTGHYPLYSNGRWVSVLKVIEPILVKYGVDMYVCGHVHQYQRTYPLDNLGQIMSSNATTYVNPKGVVHVTVGTGGFPLDHTKAPLPPQPKYMKARSVKYYGYLLLTSTKAGKLTAQFIDTKGIVRDQFTIQRFGVTVKMAAPGSKRQQLGEGEEAEDSTDEVADETVVETSEDEEEDTTTVVQSEVEEQDDNVDEVELNDNGVVEGSEEAAQSAADEVLEFGDADENAEAKVEEQKKAQKLDFGSQYGVEHEGLGWHEPNANVVAGTECFEFGPTNYWELSVPAEGVYEVTVDLLVPHHLNPTAVVLALEKELVSASQLTEVGTKGGFTQAHLCTAVVVNDTRLTFKSPHSARTKVALCGVNVTMAGGVTVRINVNPSGPSVFGNRDENEQQFIVTRQKLLDAFVQMTGEEHKRFVVTHTEQAKNGDLVADVLIRHLPTDDDLTRAQSIAEFAELSGDSFWARSGLQIERLQVANSTSDAIPKWGVITLATVLPAVVIAVALIIVVVIVLRSRRQAQKSDMASSLMMEQTHMA